MITGQKLKFRSTGSSKNGVSVSSQLTGPSLASTISHA